MAEAESQRLWRLAGMGVTMTSEILAGTLIGWLLDRVLGTDPTLLIVGTVAGIVVGLATFLRRAMAESRQAGRDAARIARRLDGGGGDDDVPSDGPDP